MTLAIEKAENGYLIIVDHQDRYVFGTLSAALRFIEKHFEGETEGDVKNGNQANSDDLFNDSN